MSSRPRGRRGDGMRTCVGCRRRAPRAALVRITAAPGGVRVAQASSGRGMWVCDDACFERATVPQLARALARPVSTAERELVRARLQVHRAVQSTLRAASAEHDRT